MTERTGLRDRPAPAIIVASLIGLVAFFYPFWLPALEPGSDATAHAADAPVVVALIGLLVGLAMAQATRARPGRPSTAKLVAVLGVLVAVNSALRLVPALGGASPIFLLIALVGYAYGATFGFLMGTLTLFVSAIITGGIGPWLPYQMLSAGWLGLTAAWLPDLEHHPRTERAMLALFGFIWGLLFGAIMNLWFWPFLTPASVAADSALLWSPGLALPQAVTHYLLFYGLTSLPYDLLRAGGNLLLSLFLARPLLFTLRRYRRRLTWQPVIRLDR